MNPVQLPQKLVDSIRQGAWVLLRSSTDKPNAAWVDPARDKSRFLVSQIDRVLDRGHFAIVATAFLVAAPEIRFALRFSIPDPTNRLGVELSVEFQKSICEKELATAEGAKGRNFRPPIPMPLASNCQLLEYEVDVCITAFELFDGNASSLDQVYTAMSQDEFEAEMMRLNLNVSQALFAAADRSVGHWDLKRANILFANTPACRVYAVCDWSSNIPPDAPSNLKEMWYNVVLATMEQRFPDMTKVDQSHSHGNRSLQETLASLEANFNFKVPMFKFRWSEKEDVTPDQLETWRRLCSIYNFLRSLSLSHALAAGLAFTRSLAFPGAAKHLFSTNIPVVHSQIWSFICRVRISILDLFSFSSDASSADVDRVDDR
eukprot:TRINITY_DN4293_c0_g1_i1.p1 TRINITY_DN4293_c0_g1~~TRINITY_DN4293_c0_g1_i1.p1  ORF type:complete len:375 (-),score=59.76 TRINITY_DN4293_c0_g1_i1:444-1568(-)